MKSKKQDLFFNAGVLTVTALIMRSVGIWFKVYISNNIGAEGMGIYKLITTVYMMALTFAISGISMAVTRIVSEEVGKGAYENIRGVIRKSCVIILILSLIVFAITFMFSKPISVMLLKDTRTLLAIRVLSLSIPFVAVSSCIKGYYYAVRNVIVPITSQLLEQFIKIIVVVNLMGIFLPKGIEYACVVLVLGTIISEIASCFYVIILYKFEKKEKTSRKNLNSKSFYSRLIEIALPVAGSSYLSSALRTVETMLIPWAFMKYGMSMKESMSVLGGVIGMIMPIIMYPAVLLMSMGTVLMPEISRAKGANNKERVDSLVSRTIGFTAIVGILAFFIFNNFYNQLGVSIYNNSELGNMFKNFSYIIPFMYISMVTDSILKGLNEQVRSLEYNLLDSILRISLIAILVPIRGIEGFIIILFISTIFSMTLSFIRVFRVTKIKVNIIDWILKPLLAGNITTIISGMLYISLSKYNIDIKMNTTIVIIVMILVYMILINMFKSISLRAK